MTHASTKWSAEKQAAHLRIADPASPDFVPFHARPENAPAYASFLRLFDGVGLHLVCAEAPCRRAGRCAGGDRRHWPPCFLRDRELVRSIVQEWRPRLEAIAAGPAEPTEPDGPATPRPPIPGRFSVLGQLRAGGVDIDLLRAERLDLDGLLRRSEERDCERSAAAARPLSPARTRAGRRSAGRHECRTARAARPRTP